MEEAVVTAPFRILLVKIGPIGDVVMASPILEAACRLYPGSRVTWLVGESLADLVGRFEPTPEIMTIDDKVLWRGSFAGRTRLMFDLWRRTAGRSFDLCLFAHSNRRLQWLTRAMRFTTWRGFESKHGRRPPIPGRRHHHEHVRLLTGHDDEMGMAGVFPRIALRSLPKSLSIPHGTIILCPGGAKNDLREDALRRWPVASYAMVARTLIEQGIPVVLAGGPSDAWVRYAFEGLGVIDRIGSTSVADSLDLFSSAKVVVAHDSGPMHLADLAGVPVVALFGPTSPHEKGPIGPSSRVLWGGAKLACRPCYDGIDYAACASNRCLQEVTPARVIEEVMELVRAVPSTIHVP